MKALVTGGAGFIGSHIVDTLLAAGHEVRVLDSLDPQVHGNATSRPAYLRRDVELVRADVRDRAAVREALHDVQWVLHQAAAVGVGQSMYQIARYVDVNAVGTSVVLEEVVAARDRIQRVLVASSMSNYGEGRYQSEDGTLHAPPPRGPRQLAAREWELQTDSGDQLEPRPTDEGKPLHPTSVYATSKRDQEELVLNVCGAYGIPAVALRYFNVYGPRQSLSNPYTGVAAIFSSRIINEQAPLLFEDGHQSRDFVHVSDIAKANLLALEADEAAGSVINVGTGVQTSLLTLCELLLNHYGRQDRLRPEVVGRFREGDIRHCFADISAAREKLGFEPSVALQDGIADLAEWGAEQTGARDRVDDAVEELEKQALLR